MVHSDEINGIPVQTGDLICTVDGDGRSILGWFWWVIGKIIPGRVDHIVIYLGPEGRCVEAAAKGRVVTFNVKGGNWEARNMFAQRGPIIDTFYGVAYPLSGAAGGQDEAAKRERVAEYCLRQAQLGRPYNLNFLNSATEKAFYCSQLAYQAYLREGINLNTGRRLAHIPGTERIIFPQEIWDGCIHRQA